jgi:hypothetical protein
MGMAQLLGYFQFFKWLYGSGRPISCATTDSIRLPVELFVCLGIDGRESNPGISVSGIARTWGGRASQGVIYPTTRKFWPDDSFLNSSRCALYHQYRACGEYNNV